MEQAVHEKLWFIQHQNDFISIQTEYIMTEVFCKQQFGTSCYPVGDIVQ